jgi:hypothetical protein
MMMTAIPLTKQLIPIYHFIRLLATSNGLQRVSTKSMHRKRLRHKDTNYKKLFISSFAHTKMSNEL